MTIAHETKDFLALESPGTRDQILKVLVRCIKVKHLFISLTLSCNVATAGARKLTTQVEKELPLSPWFRALGYYRTRTSRAVEARVLAC